MPLQLHLRDHPDARFTWLSAPGAAALSLLFLEGLGPIAERPRKIWLVSRDGEVLDEAMACDHRGGTLVTCHGGPAVRRALERAMHDAGYSAASSQPFGGTRFEKLTLGLLPQAQGALAVSMTLEAAGQSAALAELAADSVNELLAGSAACAFLYSAPRVQLWGPVNAGKSSLLNALCGQPLAAVGDQPGLTRDVIEGRLEHEGLVLRVFDAPGTWAGCSELDEAAQRLALHWRGQADLVVTLPGGAARVAELAGEAMAYDVGDKPSLARLKGALVEHFFGSLRRLAPEQRFALHPELRSDLASLGLDAVRARWLS